MVYTLDSLQAIQAYCHCYKSEGTDHVMLAVVSSSRSSSSSSSSSSSQYLTELSGAEAVGGRDDPALVDQGAAALDHLQAAAI